MGLRDILVEIKATRSRVKRSRKLGGPAYDAMSDAVVALYQWLDARSIEEVERAVRSSK